MNEEEEIRKMNIKWKQYLKCFAIVLNSLAIFFMVYVIAASAGYTVLLGDDFTHGVRVGAFHLSLPKYFIASLQYMREIYLDWQGTYFAMFLQAFLSPINNFGLSQLKIVMIINALFFFASLFGVLWTGFHFISKDNKMLCVRLTVFSVILFSILDADVFTEIFFWYSGAVAYSMPFSFMLIAIMFFLLSNYDELTKIKSNTFAACAAFFLFCAVGGSLTVSGTGCYIIMLLTLGFYFITRTVSIKNIVVTAIGIIGALINTIAPGNFSRHDYTSGDGAFLLLQSVKWAVKNVLSEMEHLTKETMFGVMFIAMILFGIYLSKRLQPIIKTYGVISILALATGFVAAFPVALGYAGPTFPNRCCFILDVVLVLSLLNLAVFIGCCLNILGEVSESRSSCAILIIIMIASFLLSPEKVSESSLLAVAESLHNGSYQNYYAECTAIYDYLENCEEDNVVLRMPSYIENFECFYFDDDETAWVNVGLAEYYHKKSVKRKNE